MSWRLPAIGALVWLSISCGDSGSGPTPVDPESDATFTVDGQTFQGSANGMSALDRGDNFMDIITKDCRANVSVVISLRGPLAPGPVPAASVLAASYFNGVQQWDAGSTGGATRSVTLTSASPRITGTYAFSGMQPLAATGATGTKSVSGSFDVSFGNGTVCQ